MPAAAQATQSKEAAVPGTTSTRPVFTRSTADEIIASSSIASSGRVGERRLVMSNRFRSGKHCVPVTLIDFVDLAGLLATIRVLRDAADRPRLRQVRSIQEYFQACRGESPGHRIFPGSDTDGRIAVGRCVRDEGAGIAPDEP
jgi:hypothetical protein